jgi:histidinol-phosphate aminotransferase
MVMAAETAAPKDHTSFILVRIGPNDVDVQGELLRRGVIVRPCTAYDLPEFLRISIGTRAENEQLVATLEETLPGE